MANKKRGLSTVIATLILVLLAVVLAGIVWTVVNDVVKKETDYTESCFGIFEKVTISNDYTCYNLSDYNGETHDFSVKEFQFGIGITDVEVDELLISVSWPGEVQSFKIPGNYPYLKYYNGNYGEDLNLPGEDSGKTYVINVTRLGFEKPDSIEIAPTINNHQCEVSDSLFEIVGC